MDCHSNFLWFTLCVGRSSERCDSQNYALRRTKIRQLPTKLMSLSSKKRISPVSFGRSLVEGSQNATADIHDPKVLKIRNKDSNSRHMCLCAYSTTQIFLGMMKKAQSASTLSDVIKNFSVLISLYVVAPTLCIFLPKLWNPFLRSQ